ncbi:MAG: DUF5752 family protein [Desulfuromonadales bacterium]
MQIGNGSPARPGNGFSVRDCALITLATGERAHSLKELREGLLRVPVGSLYHHFWGRLLRPQFDEPEYNNDFASWAWRGLHDRPLAERLSMVIPTDFDDLEGVRQEVLEIVHQRLDESELALWSAVDQGFYFLHGQVVVFSAGLVFDHPADIVSYLPSLSTGSVFFHFIDARRRTPQRNDDFSAWLAGFDGEFAPLIADLAGLDPYFSSLKELRHRVSAIFQRHFAGSA